MNFDSWWLCGSWELFTDPAISQCVSHFSVLGHNLSCQDTDVFSTTCWGQKRDLTNSAGSRLWALIQQIRASCTSKQTGTTLTDQLQQACSTNREKNNKDAATHQQAGRNNLVNVGQQTNLRAFAREGARDFDYWLVLIHEGSNKMRMEYCKDSNGSLCYLRATQGHSGGTHLPQRNFVDFSIHFGEWFHSGKKRMTRPDNQSFVQPWIHSEKTRKKKLVVLITLFLKNNTMRHSGNAIKMRYFE